MPAANWDWYVSTTAAAEAGNKRTCTLQLYVSGAAASKRQGMRAWLSDSAHGGITGTAPSTISTSPTTSSTLVREMTTKKAWTFLLNSTGALSLIIGSPAVHTWYLNTAVAEGEIKTQSVAFV